MQIVVLANDVQAAEILSKKTNDDVYIKFERSFLELRNYKDVQAFFILDHLLNNNELESFGKKPVFINLVESTLEELNLTENINRINAWPGFLQREKWDIVTQNEKVTSNIFGQLGWQYIVVRDEPGLVAARIISMIINEAYFALGDNVSTKNEIDIAMKLGTNYPYGPFEWCGKIGLKKVYDLLKKLSINNKRYIVAPVMEAEYESLKL